VGGYGNEQFERGGKFDGSLIHRRGVRLGDRQKNISGKDNKRCTPSLLKKNLQSNTLEGYFPRGRNGESKNTVNHKWCQVPFPITKSSNYNIKHQWPKGRSPWVEKRVGYNKTN